MPCICSICLQHSKTLGIPPESSSADIRKAFRAAANLWHPDRFEKEPGKRGEAEERFKDIQIAYRELWAHHDNPVRERAPHQVPEDAAEEEFVEEQPAVEEPPPISFGNSRGCFTTPNFPPRAVSIFGRHLQDTEKALAFIDLSGPRAEPEGFREYLLLTSYRLFVRDTFNIVSLLWYTDLGEIKLEERFKGGKPGFWQKTVENISGPQPRLALQIDRHNGTSFYSIKGEADDSVKKVIYNFLLQMKQKTRS
jgi:hypothetical protein